MASERSPGFSVDVTRPPGGLVVAPAGDIDLATVDQVRAACRRHVEGTLVLDLRRVDFIDTSGVGLIVECRRRADAGAFRFAVVRGSPAVQRLFDVAGLGQWLTVVDEPADALRAAGADA